MKILGIMGSSRRDGNTNDLLDAALEGAVLAGASVEKLVLLDYKIHHIYNCKDCKERGYCEPDDFPVVWEKIVAADGILFATPVYWYSVSGLLKVMLDRMCCPMYLEGTDRYLELLKGKGAGVLCTLEEPLEHNVHQPMLASMHYVITYEFHQWKDYGSVVAIGGSRGTTRKNDKAMEEARILGRTLACHYRENFIV